MVGCPRRVRAYLVVRRWWPFRHHSGPLRAWPPARVSLV